MKSVQFAWVIGAVSALGLGMAAEACSSSSTTTTNTSSSTSSSTTASSSSSVTTGSSTSVVGTSSTTGTTDDAGTGVKCYGPPGKIYPEDAAGGHQYCPFSASDASAGKAIYCGLNEQCCSPPEGDGVSTCVADTAVCPVKDSIDWVCSGTPDCSGKAGTICCGEGSILTQSAQPGCSNGDGGYNTYAIDGAAALPEYPYVSRFYGTQCQTSCAQFMGTDAGAFQVCSQTSECPSGQVCTPIKPKGNSIGYCAAGTGTGTGSSSSSTTGSSSASSTASTSGSSSSAGH